MVKNNKGMTLIELVVVMLISVILMGIAGSILLSSTGFFTKTTISDRDKLATDKIVEFIDGEIMYATNVIVSKEEPYDLDIEGNNWRYFKFEKGRLYTGYVYYDVGIQRYNNSYSELPLNNDYYGNRNLVVEAKGYDNSYRLDLTFYFYNQEKEVEYKTKSTLAFPNLKLQYDNATTKKGWFDSVEYSNIKPEDTYYIYYTKEAIAVNTGTGYGGTVADQIQCKKEINGYDNDKGYYQAIEYNIGDFVFLCSDVSAGKNCKEEDKVWYRAFGSGTSSLRPDSSNVSNPWKRITADYMLQTNYYRGDVTIYRTTNNKSYYLMYFGPKPFANIGALETDYPGEKYSLWAPVQVDVDLTPYCEFKYESGDTRYTHSYIIDSPAHHLYDSKVIKSEINKSNAYIKGKKYPSVKTKFENSSISASDIVVKDDKYYINISKGDTEVEPGSSGASEIWYCLDNVYSPNSFYFKNDIVIMDVENKSATFRAKHNIINGEKPDPYDYNNSSNWERVYFDLNSGTYKPSKNK